MKNYDINDDEIRIIGSDNNDVQHVNKPIYKHPSFVVGVILFVVLVVIAMLYILNRPETATKVQEEPGYFEPTATPEILVQDTLVQLSKWQSVDSMTAFCEIQDTIINDVVLRVYIPHNATMTLHVGRMDKNDDSVIYAAQAADVRADNGGIVGAFVLQGVPRAWGLSKRGYCASIDGVVTVGVADNSPLFEEATEKGGYFFRQYALVENGQLVDNTPKGKSVRRAICDRRGEIFMVETGIPESFHDFSQALVDLGVDNAVYLVGSSAYGWAVDEDGVTHEFGEDNYYRGRRRMPRNTSYIVWRKKI